MYGCPVHALQRASWDAQKMTSFAWPTGMYVSYGFGEKLLFGRLTTVAKAGERLGQGSEIVDD